MKIIDLIEQQTENDYLKISDLENMFDIYLDNKNNYKYNLNNTIYLNDLNIQYYILSTEAHWTTISYLLYGTTRLAWLLMKINNISAKDIFKKKYQGNIIKYISESNVQEIIQFLNEDIT